MIFTFYVSAILIKIIISWFSNFDTYKQTPQINFFSYLIPQKSYFTGHSGVLYFSSTLILKYLHWWLVSFCSPQLSVALCWPFSPYFCQLFSPFFKIPHRTSGQQNVRSRNYLHLNLLDYYSHNNTKFIFITIYVYNMFTTAGVACFYKFWIINNICAFMRPLYVLHMKYYSYRKYVLFAATINVC